MVQQLPHDQHLPTGTVLVRWLLCLTIAATVAAQAILTFRGDGTAINAFLFLDLGWSHMQAVRAERSAMSIILGVTLLGVIRPHWLLLAPVGLYLLAEACLTMHVGGRAFAQLAPAAAALRFMTPLVTPFVLASYLKSFRLVEPRPVMTAASATSARMGRWLLKLAVAVVFITHGYEAIMHHPQFIDLVIGTGTRMFDVWLDESKVTRLLTLIGTVDIIVGVALLFRWSPTLLGWAAFWGLLTALSRMTAYGWGAYPDVLLRSTHFGVPLALLLLSWRSSRDEVNQGTSPTTSGS